MSDTPTPRTDEQINGKPCTRFGLLAGMSLRDALVPSEFARQLERELAALRLDNLTAHKMACAAGIERDTLRAELERFAIEVGHAAFTAAQRLLQERDTAERDARNAEATS